MRGKLIEPDKTAELLEQLYKATLGVDQYVKLMYNSPARLALDKALEAVKEYMEKKNEPE